MIDSRYPTSGRKLLRNCFGVLLAGLSVWGMSPTAHGEELADAKELISQTRQLTFAGRRAGEGYFSADGSKMVFQSERLSNNPFFQIYLMDLETGDMQQVSPGTGKTTCAWISPAGDKVMYASTQYDPEAVKKQTDELEFRASGKTRRYSWDYDPTYEIVAWDAKSKEYERLTNTLGYDAEGSYSPDGSKICFASNRRAYSGELSAKEQKLFEINPSSAMDIYIMNADGSGVQRLTDAIGYDGGPFFSPDGKQICWRRFDSSGETAEIMLMDIDGSNQRAITRMGVMSWAPYFHPSGDYLIFGTNKLGFDNFELYIVDAQGKADPVRVTFRDGFDGLPVFKPDGETLVWTSNGGGDESQLFQAKWDDALARKLLSIEPSSASDMEAIKIARDAASATSGSFSAADVGRHIDYLCRPELGGRLTGTRGERLATAYVAAYLESLGLQPAGENGYFHEFDFVSDVALGESNKLAFGDEEYKLGTRWRPVFFSKEGEIPASEIVCAGYGIVAPAEGDFDEYDSYVHLDVQDKWVLVFRQMPQDISPERRQHLSRYSGERFKAMVARDNGARGIIFVSGPTSPLRNRLVPLQMDGSLGASSIAVVSVDDSVALKWATAAGKDLKEIQKTFDSGEPSMGIPFEGVSVSAFIDIEQVTSTGRNVIAVLPAKEGAEAEQRVLIGAHIDHLGNGQGGGSLANEDEQGQAHRGADDNASGVAAVLEIAQYFAGAKKRGQVDLKRDLMFAFWSGEELGLRGSQAFVADYEEIYGPVGAAHGHAAHGEATHGEATHGEATHGEATHGEATHGEAAHGEAGKAAPDPHAAIAAHSGMGGGENTMLYPELAAAFNLDMVGRLRENLVLQGIGSSDYWEQAIERRNAVVGLPLTLQDDCFLPTDASTFYLAGVPILSAFTGNHSEYHTPRDVPELINFDGTARIARLMALILRDVAISPTTPNYKEVAAEPQIQVSLTASLGTVPDYSGDIETGVLLGGVRPGQAAEEAGVKRGDIVLELAGKKIDNIYDYTYAIDALKVGETVKIKVKRGEDILTLDITPKSKK